MVVETTRISSKGQIVIPQSIREELNIEEGTMFAVMGSKDSIILKRMKIPDKEELFKGLDGFAEYAEKQTKKLGIKESDVVGIVHRYRKKASKSRSGH